LILVLILTGLLFAPLPVAAQEYDPVEADIWIELDAAYDTLDPVRMEEARRLADGEARFLLSGMIYGYSFSYRPLDRERGIDEEFLLESEGEISQAKLVPVDVRGRGSRVMLLYRYYPDLKEYLRISSWLGAAVPSVIGYGEARFVLGHEGKMEAYRQALKEAVREYLRPRVRNKPRRIEGELFLIDTPGVGVQAGKYTVRMRLRINIRDVDGYLSY
jgi:hypothetical protein